MTTQFFLRIRRIRSSLLFVHNVDKKRCYFQVEILKAKQVPSFEFAPATQLRKSNEHLSYSDVYLKEVNCTGKLRHQNRKLNAIISQ